MIKTYSELLDEISELEEGQELRISDIEFIENFDLYKRAERDGYIMLMLSSLSPLDTILRYAILKKPKEIVSDEFISFYFG